MQNSIQIKQFELSEKDALLSFLKIGYPDNPRMSDARFWEWHFLKNPYVEPDNLPIWIARDGEKIVGQLAGTPVELKVGDEKKPAVWILDFVVRPDYRDKGLGKRLVNASQEFCPLGLGVNTYEQHSPALLKKLGWVIAAKIPRYSKLLFPGNALREISQIKFLRQFVNFCYAAFRPRFPQMPVSGNGYLRNVEEFDSSFDTLWQESSAQWACGVVRSSKILKWQYFQQPGKKFNVLGFYENDKLLGYIILYFRKPDSSGVLSKAAITDICYHPSQPVQIIDDLLRGALQLAVQRGAGSLVTDVIDPLVQERLTLFGFWKTKNPLLLMMKSNARRELLYNSANWFLTRGDSDISIFEHPNL